MSCILCKDKKVSGTIEVESHILNICSNCGLFYLSPYDIPLIESRHEEDISAEKQYKYEVQFYKKYFDKIKRYITQESTILDIGCGAGHFLELARPHAKSCVGIELNNERFKFARNKSNCEIHQNPIEEFDVLEKFDIILLSNLFSHLDLSKNPFPKIIDSLTPTGKLILITGEVDPRVQPNSVFTWGLPEHRQFLGLNTISTFCHNNNLKIIEQDRKLISEEIFSKEYFLSPGRSPLRNLIKRTIATIPLGLYVSKKYYEYKRGKYVYSSFICLEKNN